MSAYIEYHDAERETGDDGIFDREGGEVEGTEVAGEGLGDGTEGVLADWGEDGRTGEVPELSGFDAELSEEISNSGDGWDIIGIGNEGRKERTVGWS